MTTLTYPVVWHALEKPWKMVAYRWHPHRGEWQLWSEYGWRRSVIYGTTRHPVLPNHIRAVSYADTWAEPEQDA